MLHFLILVIVLLAAAAYYATREERTRVFRLVVAALYDVKDAVTLQGLKCDAFFDALRARTGRVIVTPALILLSATITLVSPGRGDGILDLLVNAACLLQIGLILERLVGRLAFTTIYVAAGVAAGIVNLPNPANRVTIEMAGSVFGMYGLLLVTSLWGVIHRSDLTIPLNVAKRLAPVAAVFIVYHLIASALGAGELIAFICGVIGGVVVAREVNERTPAIRQLAGAMATVLAIVAVYAIAVIVMHHPASASTDVRPEIERVIALEHRTAGTYDAEVDRFRKGRITAIALAEVIQQSIVPELHAMTARLNALKEVAPHDQPVVATSQEFLRLRDESWQLRAAALRGGDMVGLRQADSKEQTSLEAFQRLRTTQF